MLIGHQIPGSTNPRTPSPFSLSGWLLACIGLSKLLHAKTIVKTLRDHLDAIAEYDRRVIVLSLDSLKSALLFTCCDIFKLFGMCDD